MSSSTGSSKPDAYNSAALDSINSKLLADGGPGGSTSFPSVVMPGGKIIRTGTVATVLHNIGLYDAAEAKVKAGGSGADTAKTEMDALEAEIRLAVPTLKEVGMFDLFTTDEWMSGGTVGRRLVGHIAKELGF